MLAVFYKKRDSKRANPVGVRNSPGDCFGARVRAGERGSEPGESLHLRQKAAITFVVVVFLCLDHRRISNCVLQIISLYL